MTAGEAGNAHTIIHPQINWLLRICNVWTFCCRFCLFEVVAKNFQSIEEKSKYFKEIVDERANGGLEALMAFFLNYDCSGFEPLDHPSSCLGAMVAQKFRFAPAAMRK